MLAVSLSPALAALLVVLAMAGGVAWLRPGSAGLRRLTAGLGLAGCGASVAVWALRWREAGHLPLFGTYESSLSLSAAVLVAATLAWLLGRDRQGVWPVAGLVAGGILAHGLLFDPTVWALTISERSWVVDVHALLAWAAFGALTVNTGFAVGRCLRRGGDGPRLDRPLAVTLHWGFFLHSAMLASGSLYKFLLFGRAWSFDPIETLGLIAWVAYGTVLHMHLLAGWEGRRLAAWCIALFALLVVSYRGIVYFPAWSTYHIFDMDLRMHVVGREGAPAGGGE